MMFQTILFTFALVFAAFILLAVRVLFVKNGRFPNIHIGSNKAMRKRGISCAQSTDANDRAKMDLKEVMNYRQK